MSRLSARLAPALFALVAAGCNGSTPAPVAAAPPPAAAPPAAVPPATPSAVPESSPATPPGSARHGDMLRIGGYDLELPSWWASTHVGRLPDLRTEDAIFQHVKATYGEDVGTEANWQKAAKTWALLDQRRDAIPIFFAHCLMTGKDFARAAKIYADLQVLAKTGPKGEWFGCYLAYNAGEAYSRAGELDEAARWYRESAAYSGSKDGAVAYYAKESSNALAAMGK